MTTMTFDTWWADSNFSADEFDNSTRTIAKVVWNIRQYEINTLKDQVTILVNTDYAKDNQIAELKAEIEELKDEAQNIKFYTEMMDEGTWPY